MPELNKIVEIGDKINVKTKDKHNSYTYVSQISNISGDDIIGISLPMYKGETIYFINGEKLTITIVKKQGIYEFNAVVIGKEYDNIPIIKLKITSGPIRIQRRNFYRLKIVKPIKYRLINDIEDSEENIDRLAEGILLDISEGGLMFCTKEELEKDNMLELMLDIGEKNEMKLIGTIIRKQINEEKPGIYEYGVKFKNLNKQDRNTLTKFIFEEQRKLLKKRML